jgi:signal transduction histidine kinase
MLRRLRSIHAFVGVGCALVAATIALVASFEAARQNEFSLQTQHAIAQYQTRDIYLDMQGKLTAMTYWLDAYDNVVGKWKPSWVEYEFWPYLLTLGIRNVAIVGPDGRFRFFTADRKELPASAVEIAKAPGFDELLAAARAARKAGLPDPRHGIVAVGAKPYFAVAAAIVPETAIPGSNAPERQFLAVFLKPVRTQQYAVLTEDFRAAGLSVAPIGAIPSGFTALLLTDANGNARAQIAWRPYRPGENFVSVLFPVLFAMFLALALSLAVVIRRWQAAHKRLQDTELKVAAAEDESRIKSVFLGNVSHELRTPLNAIIGFAEMLRLKMFGPLGASRYEGYVDHILASGQNLLKTVDDLIEIAHLEAHDDLVERETLDAVEALHAAVKAVQNAALEKNVALVFANSRTGAWCSGSSLRLRQAISRLLENAVQASKSGQTVTVFWRREDDEIVVGVRDRGAGMPAELAARVGRLFLYSDDHFVSRYGGIGLGLAIAQGLIRLMGGRMTAASELGEGSTISLHLPVAAAPKKSDSQLRAA